MDVCMDVNKLYECKHSAYHNKHNTEYAQNGLLCAVDDGCAVVLVLLD